MPAVRRLLRCALAVLRIDRQAGNDLELALTEACANVVKHAVGAENIEVRVDVDEHLCAIDVLDSGAGFDAARAQPVTDDGSMPDPLNDSGRGLFLIGALSDSVRMDTSPRRGCLIHFETRLTVATSAATAVTG